MSLQDKSELIKVHVTQCQREYLEFLVNRRLNDLVIKYKANYETLRGITEYTSLVMVKSELQHAGT